jgi:hypothetical protein
VGFDRRATHPGANRVPWRAGSVAHHSSGLEKQLVWDGRTGRAGSSVQTNVPSRCVQTTMPTWKERPRAEGRAAASCW